MSTTKLTPIVIDLPDRGVCAIDYIDYFDEGIKGPDKPYFIGRYRNLDDVAAQMDKCLALQTTPGSIIHFKRLDIDGKWVEPLVGPDTKYPRRANYAIRFLLRIKFFGDFGYLDIGADWNDILIAYAENDNLVILPQMLKVVNSCWLSSADSQKILDTLLGTLTYEGGTKYDPETDSVIDLTAEEAAALNAEYLVDDEGALADDEGALTA